MVSPADLGSDKMNKKLWPILIFIVSVVAWLVLAVILVLFHLYDLVNLTLGLGVTAIAISSVSMSLAYRLPNVRINLNALYFSIGILSTGAAMYLVSYLIEGLAVTRNLAFAIDLIGIAGLLFVVRRTPKS